MGNWLKKWICLVMFIGMVATSAGYLGYTVRAEQKINLEIERHPYIHLQHCQQIGNDIVEIIKVDGCQYVVYRSSGSLGGYASGQINTVSIIHKENCENPIHRQKSN